MAELCVAFKNRGVQLLLDGVVEMGGSIRPLVHTLQYVEDEPYRLGRTYWQSLATVWPNLAARFGS